MYSKIVGKKSSPCPRAYSSTSTCIATSSGGKLEVSTVAISLRLTLPPPGIAMPSTRESRHKAAAIHVPTADEQAESLPRHSTNCDGFHNTRRELVILLMVDVSSFVFPCLIRLSLFHSCSAISSSSLPAPCSPLLQRPFFTVLLIDSYIASLASISDSTGD